MGRSRYRPIYGHPHFVTFSVVNWLPILSQPALAHILLDTLRFLHAERRLIVHAYVLMENHCHLVVSAEDTSKEIGCLKSFTARQIVEQLKRYRRSFWLEKLKRLKASYKMDQKFQVWQEGFHPKAIFTAEMLNQKIDYIHNNPVKRGYVDHPTDWRYSSARNYKGLPGERLLGGGGGASVGSLLCNRCWGLGGHGRAVAICNNSIVAWESGNRHRIREGKPSNSRHRERSVL